jgi:hypothetical protein
MQDDREFTILISRESVMNSIEEDDLISLKEIRHTRISIHYIQTVKETRMK